MIYFILIYQIQLKRSTHHQKNTGFFVQINNGGFPISDSLGFDESVGLGEVGGYAQQGIWSAGG